MDNESKGSKKVQPGSCGCGGGCTNPGDDRRGVGRRSFLKIAGLGASAAVLPKGASGEAAADPAGNVQHFVPADKKLSPQWIASLTAKGEPAVYQGKDLATLAMPIGGIGTGQLYLCGDGTLAGWSIFNRQEFSGYGSLNYNSNRPTSPVEQGLAVTVEVDGKKSAKRLSVEDFPGVAFRGEYPIGKVMYADDDFPVRVELEAFSPFIPLLAKDSALPATVFNFTVHNSGDRPAKVSVLGWLANAGCCHSAEYVYDRGRRTTQTIRVGDQTTILHGVRELPAVEQPKKRPDVVLADFENGSYGEWKVEGKAPGSQPAAGAVANQSPIEGVEGHGLVNTYTGTDEAVGKLVSPPFEINRRYINLKVGGG